MRTVICTAFLLLAILITGCNKEIEPPVGAVTVPTQPLTPQGLNASIGDGEIVLSWTVSDPSLVDHYRVYSAESLATAPMVFRDTTSLTNYTVTNLVNSRRYYFRVSAVDKSGLEGEMASAISAVPGIFAINIESGSKYTKTCTVSVGLTAPSGTSLVELSEDSTFADAQWGSYSSSKSFELSDNDGMKRLYARFQLSSGANSAGLVGDSIILDQIAIINRVEAHNFGDTLLHFAVYTSESEGTASVTVDDLGTISLNNLGLAGDAHAGDTVYEVDYAISPSVELVNAEVTGHFTDEAGNVAGTRTTTEPLNVIRPPHPVTLALSSTTNNDTVLVELNWSRAMDDDFASYQILKSTVASDTVQYNVNLIESIINSQTQTSFEDELTEAGTYYFRVFVVDEQEEKAGSNTVTVTVP